MRAAPELLPHAHELPCLVLSDLLLSCLLPLSLALSCASLQLAELCKEKPAGLDAVRFLGQWLLDHNPNQPAVQEPE